MRALHVVTACAICASGLVAGTAHAADNGIYAGLSIGQSTTEFPGEVSDFFDDKDVGFKLTLGLRPLDWLGVEVSYLRLGEVTQKRDAPEISGFELEQSGFAAYGIAFLEVATFDLFAKAGLVSWSADLSVDTMFGRFDENDNGTDLAWGLGAQVRFGSLAARLEYERFEIDTADGLIGKPELLSLGVTWTFF